MVKNEPVSQKYRLKLGQNLRFLNKGSIISTPRIIFTSVRAAKNFSTGEKKSTWRLEMYRKMLWKMVIKIENCIRNVD